MKIQDETAETEKKETAYAHTAIVQVGALHANRRKTQAVKSFGVSTGKKYFDLHLFVLLSSPGR